MTVDTRECCYSKLAFVQEQLLGQVRVLAEMEAAMAAGYESQAATKAEQMARSLRTLARVLVDFAELAGGADGASARGPESGGNASANAKRLADGGLIDDVIEPEDGGLPSLHCFGYGGARGTRVLVHGAAAPEEVSR